MMMEILLSTMAFVGMAGGISALVLYRKQNGNGHRNDDPWDYKPEPPPEPPVAPQLAEDRQLAKLAEAIQPLTALPKQLEARFELTVERLANTLEAYGNVPQPEPDWPADLLQSVQRLYDLEASRIDIAANLERLTHAVEALVQMGPPTIEIPAPVVEMPPILPEIENRFDRIVKQIAKHLSHAPASQPLPVQTPPPPEEWKPVSRSAAPIVLEEFNTITVAEFTVYELRPVETGVFNANVLNLGPGWLYMRESEEPTIGDPLATTLPPGGIDNEIRVAERLYVLASADGTITVRLMH